MEELHLALFRDSNGLDALELLQNRPRAKARSVSLDQCAKRGGPPDGQDLWGSGAITELGVRLPRGEDAERLGLSPGGSGCFSGGHRAQLTHSLASEATSGRDRTGAGLRPAGQRGVFLDRTDKRAFNQPNELARPDLQVHRELREGGEDLLDGAAQRFFCGIAHGSPDPCTTLCHRVVVAVHGVCDLDSIVLPNLKILL